MGHEASCCVILGKKRVEGKALLETSELIFRGRHQFRLKIRFSDMHSVKVVKGALHIQTSDVRAVLELGATAEKWCEKILHPKTRMEKLGVKPQAAIFLVGNFSTDFLAELEACTANVTEANAGTNFDCVFFAVRSREELVQLPKLAKLLRGSAALWVLYPKGQKHITQSDVLTAGRKAGLKDIKVIGFSPLQTALKFVIPLSDRQ
jgi:hypothetical protein